MTMSEEPHFLRRMVLMSAGLIIWAAHFTVIYGFNALACARAFAGIKILGFGLVPVVVVLLTLVALAGTAAILLASVRAGRTEAANDGQGEQGFVRYITITVAALSLIAIAWNGLPTLLVSPCAQNPILL